MKLAQSLEVVTPYRYVKSTALLLQGIEVDSELQHVEVQWDLFDNITSQFKEYIISPITRTANHAQFTMVYEGVTIQVSCQFNMTVRTDPYHISVVKEGHEVWIESLYAHLFRDKQYEEVVRQYLSDLQEKLTHQNKLAWNQDQYDALVERYGEPEKTAKKVSENPEWRLHPFYRHFGNVNEKKVVHLLGSNGIKGVALSLLGANVTVVDFSKENAEYAKALAKEAGVALDYIESDIFSLQVESVTDTADIILMELGVLHYFMDLQPLFHTVKSFLKRGGIFLLHEFHPISTKLITSSGKKHKVTGNYFSPRVESGQVAFSKHMGEQQEQLVKVSQRKWTIGEVVTMLGQEGLLIRTLEEEPNHKVHDIGLPKTYTIVAEKI
jgi:2-polyprenyl-3-methyl-5-hydroxy-6-metoxy-1,4-benzoquinol methylase